MTRFRLAAMSGLAAGMLVISAGHIGAQHVALPDARIQELAEHELGKRSEFKNVTVEVAAATVTLRGEVRSLWAKDEAIGRALSVEDVESVISELTIPGAESNEVLAEQIAEKIRNYVLYTIFDDVNIEVNDGVVRLTGQVSQPYRANEMAKLATRVAGVIELHNNFEVLPVSIHDDQIRWTLASRIYNDTVFEASASWPNPPVHIIVKGGRVTLTGVVNSQVERRVAEVIARGTFGVFSVENKLKLERDLNRTRW